MTSFLTQEKVIEKITLARAAIEKNFDPKLPDHVYIDHLFKVIKQTTPKEPLDIDELLMLVQSPELAGLLFEINEIKGTSKEKEIQKKLEEKIKQFQHNSLKNPSPITTQPKADKRNVFESDPVSVFQSELLARKPEALLTKGIITGERLPVFERFNQIEHLFKNMDVKQLNISDLQRFNGSMGRLFALVESVVDTQIPKKVKTEQQGFVGALFDYVMHGDSIDKKNAMRRYDTNTSQTQRNESMDVIRMEIQQMNQTSPSTTNASISLIDQLDQRRIQFQVRNTTHENEISSVWLDRLFRVLRAVVRLISRTAITLGVVMGILVACTTLLRAACGYYSLELLDTGILLAGADESVKNHLAHVGLSVIMLGIYVVLSMGFIVYIAMDVFQRKTQMNGWQWVGNLGKMFVVISGMTSVIGNVVPLMISGTLTLNGITTTVSFIAATVAYSFPRVVLESYFFRLSGLAKRMSRAGMFLVSILYGLIEVPVCYGMNIGGVDVKNAGISFLNNFLGRENVPDVGGNIQVQAASNTAGEWSLLIVRACCDDVTSIKDLIHNIKEMGKRLWEDGYQKDDSRLKKVAAFFDLHRMGFGNMSLDGNSHYLQLGMLEQNGTFKERFTKTTKTMLVESMELAISYQILFGWGLPFAVAVGLAIPGLSLISLGWVISGFMGFFVGLEVLFYFMGIYEPLPPQENTRL